jgi:hypothetical protein
MTYTTEVMHMGSSPGFPDDADAVPDRGSPPRMPHWVKWSAIVVAALILLMVVVMSVFGGQHGPGRHLPAGDAPPAITAPAADASGGSQG